MLAAAMASGKDADVEAVLAAIGDAYAAMPCHGGKPGHPVLLSPAAFPAIAAFTGDEGAGRLLRSRDNGVTWTTQELGSESLRSLVFAGHTGLAVGNQGQAFLSTDGGDSWQAVKPFTREHLFDVAVHRGEWLTTGDRGALFRTQTPSGTWQAWTPDGLDKSYHSRLLDTADGVVLIGHQLGLLRQDDLQLWPREQQQ